MKRALSFLAPLLVASALCHGDTGSGTPAPSLGTRDRILFEARKLVGVREATGRNDGTVVESILASTGNRRGDAWCASANRYIYDLAGFGLRGPRSAWSPGWVARPTWTFSGGGRTPLPGDAFGIFFPSKGRIAHTGLVGTWGKSVVVTFEGNTSPDAVPGSAADRDGGGYWSKRRLIRQIHSVRNWIDP